MTDIHAAPATIILSAGRTLDHRARWAARLFGLGVRHVLAQDDGAPARAEHAARLHGAGQTWRVSRIVFDDSPPVVPTDLPILWWYANDSDAFWAFYIGLLPNGSTDLGVVVRAMCGQDVPPAALWLCESSGVPYPMVARVLMTETTRLSFVPSDPDEMDEQTLRRLLANTAIMLR